MKSIGLNELRQMFREFYVGKEHLAHKSYSLIPESDKSLLLINSGMAPLKPYFAGLEMPPSKRMTTCQKCIRTGDLENVGHTDRHGTFFEMLGSFSFGDYFKRESLIWGWEFLIEVLELPEDKLWASVYEEDDEAYDIWVNEVGITPDRVIRMGKEENFWEIGLGPCGPCSEVYYDRGEKYGCGSPDCKPGCECDRYVEFWNHVFTQFSRDEAGNYTPLAQPNIDTGMGLERIACIMQETDSIYNVDTLRSIIERVSEASGVEYRHGEAGTDVSIRVITDHIRSVVFMIGDGIIPSNEGRGYVLRRLLRRAVVHGKKLGISEPFLFELADKVIDVSGHEYEEIAEKRTYIKRLIKTEEERFAVTIDQGLEMLGAHIQELKGSKDAVLSGEMVFKLYDTYGMNPELTREVLAEHGIATDDAGYEAEFAARQENSRKGHKISDAEGWKADADIFKDAAPTEFVGYKNLLKKCSVNQIFVDKRPVAEVCAGETAAVVLDRTPFYAEGGGQASDIGEISNDDGIARVLSVEHVGAVFVHSVEVAYGTIKTGDKIKASVDVAARNKTARNHTATHLLQKALSQKLGSHVRQAGSSVDAHVLRFDFTHFEGLDPETRAEIEEIVNNVIDEFRPVTATLTTIDKAKKHGAVALFSEKYGDLVRMVTVDGFCAELCGGTHVKNTGEIGGFKIISEASIGSGVRRIEALTGTNLLAPFEHIEKTMNDVASLLKTNPDVIRERVSEMLEYMREAKRDLEAAKKVKSGSIVAELIAEASEKGAVRLVKGVFDDMDVNGLRELSDSLKAASDGLVNVLISKADGKVTIITSVSDDLLDKGWHAGNLVKELAAAGGGGGGGKADLAQAGTKDAAKIPEILAAAEKYIAKNSKD